MTEEDLQQWRALSEKASPGPWCHVQTRTSRGEIHCDVVRVGPQQTTLAYDGDGGDADFYERDAAFIAVAREAVPALIAEVERLRAIDGADASGVDITVRLRGFLGGSGTTMTPLAAVPHRLDLWRLLRDAADTIDRIRLSSLRGSK
jgi:hypothetical protein